MSIYYQFIPSLKERAFLIRPRKYIRVLKKNEKELGKGLGMRSVLHPEIRNGSKDKTYCQDQGDDGEDGRKGW